MVHRPADSRLLTNLLKHEKDSFNSLTGTLDLFQHSLSALHAYASASSPPASQVIIAVANYLASADDALRKYSVALEDWRLKLQSLKDLEDEVGNVMRDREILVNRLIKASKSKSPRDSIHLSPSTSTSSLTKGSGSRLNLAQAELQACESHLGSKEKELEHARLSVVAEGLRSRCKAMVECGWVWGEMGKESMSSLDNFHAANATANMNGSATRSPFFKPLPNPILPENAASDISSLLPSHSASQLALPAPMIESPLRRGRLELDPPHSVSDHAFPLHQEPEPIQSDSSDEAEPKGPLEVHENRPFQTIKRSKDQVHFVSPPKSRSEIGFARSSYVARRKEEEKKTRKRSTSFFGGIAALFRSSSNASGSRWGRDDSSDEEDPPTMDYAAVQQRLRHLPSISQVPTSSDGVRLRKKPSHKRASTIDDSIILMKGENSVAAPSSSPEKRRAQSTSSSALGRVETTKSTKSASMATSSPVRPTISIAEPLYDEPVNKPSRNYLEIKSSSVKRSDTVKSNSSKASRRSLSSDSRAFDGGSVGLRSGIIGGSTLVSNQPSLLTVIEGIPQSSRGSWSNGVKSHPALTMQPAKAPGSVFDKLNLSPQSISSTSAPVNTPTSTIRTGSTVKENGNITELTGMPPTSLVSASPSSALISPSPLRHHIGPLRSALRNRTPSPAPPPKAPTILEEVQTTMPKVTAAGPANGTAPNSHPLNVSPPDDDATSTGSDYETGHEELTEDEVVTPSPSAPAIKTASTHKANQLADENLSISSNSTAVGQSSRRKSVRMSLHPTFSPTPPALEDEPRKPWDTSSRRQPLLSEKPSRVEPPRDSWIDSSDEDDEYSKVHHTLTKVARKFAKAGK